MTSIGREISASEIQHLLDEGRTRTEVCKLLDICSATLRKYVGNDQNRKPRAKKVTVPNDTAKHVAVPVDIPESKPAYAPKPVPEKTEEERKPVVNAKKWKREVVNKEYIHGDFAVYVIDHVCKNVTISRFIGADTPLSESDFHDITREFMWIYEEVKNA